ncbi:adenylate/guanylate cyclase domain-containing protein [Candidatus Entotheonella palauensis]|nr:adenylate/guanylate cyclase domain-containing protein [Candidatus Entotheonella palauensis]
MVFLNRDAARIAFFRRTLSQIMPFGLIWLFFGIIYSILEKGLLGSSTVYPATGNPYEFVTAMMSASLGTLLMGWMMGTVELLLLKRLFIKKTFGQKLLLKTTIYVAALILFLVVTAQITNSIRMERSLFHPVVVQAMLGFLSNFAFLSLIIYSGAIVTITLFFTEVSDSLGANVLKNFFLGKYHTPQEEERVFMFLDMKSSTTIAEQLGHTRYFDLLNKYYADMSEALIQTFGEIYQYVGDEMVVSWTLKHGIRNNNCLRCFFLIKATYHRLAEKYEKQFGLVPAFKAGFHYGKITTGEIGVLKKEILFTGDVLNTTARIQGSCNTYGVDILISSELLSLLSTEEGYQVQEIGEVELQGRHAKVKLFTVKQSCL